MRIATFNILNGRAPAGRARSTRSGTPTPSPPLDADVLALQEVDRDQPRSGGRGPDGGRRRGDGQRRPTGSSPVLRGLRLGRRGWRRPSDGLVARLRVVRGGAAQPRYPVLRTWETLSAAAARAARFAVLPAGASAAVRSWVREEPRAARHRRAGHTPTGRVRAANDPPVLRAAAAAVASCGHCPAGWGSPRCRRSSRAISTSDPVALPERPGCERWRAGHVFRGESPTVQLDHILVAGGLRAVSGGPVRTAGVRPPGPCRGPAARPVAAVSKKSSATPAPARPPTTRRSAARRAPRAARRPTTTRPRPDPSSARAASPALLSISSAILVSIVCAAMMRHAVTGSS